MGGAAETQRENYAFLRESRMLKHGDFSPQDDHRYDQPDRDERPDDAEYPYVDRVVGRAEFAGTHSRRATH